MIVKNKAVYKISVSALFAALICVATAVFPVPLPTGGFFNFGDCFIIVAALCIGPLWGGLAAGVGAGLSDLILGFAVYSLVTFVVKFLMAVVIFYVAKGIRKTGFKYDVVTVTAAAAVGEVVMIAGYFLFEIFYYGFAGAAADVLGNAIQGACGMVSGSLVFNILSKTGVTRKLF